MLARERVEQAKIDGLVWPRSGVLVIMESVG
jgi:hypothetical protein